MVTPIPNNVIRPPKPIAPDKTEVRITILENEIRKLQDELALLKEYKGNKVKPAIDRIFLKDVLIAVCKYTDLNPHDILSQNRVAYLVSARSLFINLCLELTGYGVTFIGRKCGQRDHTTVCYHQKCKAQRTGHWSLKRDSGIRLWSDFNKIRKQLLDAKEQS